MKKFETVDSVVTDIVASIGLSPSDRGYVGMTRVLLRTLDELSYNITPTVKSTVVEVKDNLTIDYPSDAYSILSAGVCLSDGSVAILGRLNHSQVSPDKPSTCSCTACGGEATNNTDPAANASDVCPDCIFFNYVEGNVYTGELYGFVEEGYPYGRYYDNKEEQRLEFNSAIRAGNNIAIKYHLAVDKHSHKLIPVDAYPLVRTKTLATYYQASNPRKAQMFERLYGRELRLLKKRTMRYRYKDYIDALTSEYTNAAR